MQTPDSVCELSAIDCVVRAPGAGENLGYFLEGREGTRNKRNPTSAL